jgi:hypothetical protein
MKIVKIKHIKEIECNSKRYDIQTKETNNFFANGILVHNSMIQVYYDWHKQEWFAGTTGMAEAEGEVNNIEKTSFSTLFWQTLTKYNFDKTKLQHHFTYVFELTTPYNIVVKPHGESSATLLTIRNIITLEELGYEEVARVAKELNLPMVKSYDLNAKNFGALIKTFDGMPWSDEGYVVVDSNFNRVKIKNPAYLAVHHLKNKTAEHNILTIVKSNEIEEFASTFPERKDELLKLKVNYDILLDKLNEAWVELKPRLPKNITSEEKKKFAMAVFEVTKKYGLDSFTGLYFSMQIGRVSSVKEYLMGYDEKKLYIIL